MTSLGNIECTPLASLTFVNFMTGDILYLTGEAKNLVGPEAHSLMPFQKALTTIHTTGFVFVGDALPVRQKAGTQYRASPYSPPVRLLAEEASTSLFQSDERPEAVLTRITLHDPQIATFTWEASKDLYISPGQALILDCAPFLSARQYQELCPLNPTSFADEPIRTWTASSFSAGPTRSFSITLRHKPGGALTTAFFSMARRLHETRGGLLYDVRPLQLTLKIAGITGHFTLPPHSPFVPRRRDFVWFAAGIGLTPFLSMLGYLCGTVKDDEVNVRFFLSTREPDTLLPLVFRPFKGSESEDSHLSPSAPLSNVNLSVDVFCSDNGPARDTGVPNTVILQQHTRRLDSAFIEAHKADIVGKDVYVCGPENYTQMVIGMLTTIGVESDRVRTEGFSY